MSNSYRNLEVRWKYDSLGKIIYFAVDSSRFSLKFEEIFEVENFPKK